MNRDKIKIDWVNHLVGFVSVVLGVVLAFWLNSWSEGNRMDDNRRVALQNIKSEMIKNEDNLDTIIVNNQKLHDFLSLYLELMNAEMKVVSSDEEWQNLIQKYPQYLQEGKSGVQVDLELFQLSQVAWTAAHRTDAFSAVDFELAFLMEKCYDLQEKLNEFDSILIEDLKGIGGKKDSFLRLQRSLGFALGIANNLQEKNYPESIDAIDQYLKK